MSEILSGVLVVALVVVGVGLLQSRGRNKVLEKQIQTTVDTNKALKGRVAVTEDSNRILTRERNDALEAQQVAQYHYQVATQQLVQLRGRITLAPDTNARIRRPGSPFAMESVQVQVSDSLPNIAFEIPGPVADLIRSCDRTLATCEQARLMADGVARAERKRATNLERQSALKDEQIANLEKQSALKDERPRPGRFGFKEGMGVGAGLVLVVCLLGGCH